MVPTSRKSPGWTGVFPALGRLGSPEHTFIHRTRRITESIFCALPRSPGSNTAANLSFTQNVSSFLPQYLLTLYPGCLFRKLFSKFN